MVASPLLFAGVGWADVITVDDDAPADFDTIQDAVDFALDGDEIEVGPGVYWSSAENVMDTLGKAITIRAISGPGETVIDGKSSGRGIICQSGEGADTVIEGFTVRHCVAPWYDWNDNGQSDFWEHFGGGMWCRDGSSPTVRSCFFTENQAEYGGAIYNGDENGEASNPTIVDCFFSLNRAAPSTGGVGGAIYNFSSSPAISASDFHINSAGSGGAILNWSGSDPLVNDCGFVGNQASNGGAVYNESSSPRFMDCSFSGNEGSNDGGAVFNAEPGGSQHVPVFERCTFSDNVTNSEGGGMHNFSISPEITECVFSGNQASTGGAIRSWNTSTPSIHDTLICGNSTSQISGPYSDLGGNTIAESCPSECIGDLDGNDIVDGADLNQLLGEWGQSGTEADFDGSGLVDGEDLLVLLSAWGPCS